MKKSVLVFVLMLFVLFHLAMAEVQLNNFTLVDKYSNFDIIQGEVNLTLDKQNAQSELSSNLQQKIPLIEFLEKNLGGYNCFPYDCSDSYVLDGESSDYIEIGMQENINHYFGFVLYGEDMRISDIGFNFSSNFAKSEKVPLRMNLFEDIDWQFSKISESYGSRNWGCYDIYADEKIESPYIRGTYCEKVLLDGTFSVLAGADIFGEDDKTLQFVLYNDALTFMGSCDFKPFAQEESCVINSTGFFDSGNYYLCIRPKDEPTDYRLYAENVGQNCGWSGEEYINSKASTEDYAINIRRVKYDLLTETEVSKDKDEFAEIVSAADLFIDRKYRRNCSEGCYVPILAKGVSQKLKLSDLKVSYSIGGKSYEEHDWSRLIVEPAKIDFSGILDLGLTGFNVSVPGKKDFILYLDGNALFDKEINVVPAPIIGRVYPINPPAGIAVDFYADVDSESRIEKYIWNFGDNKTSVTYEPVVSHAYALGSYSLTLEVVDEKGLSSERSFSIVAGSPEEVLNITLEKKREKLENAKRGLESLDYWYQSDLGSMLRISFYEDSLEGIEKMRALAENETDFFDVAVLLQELNVPNFIVPQSVYSGSLVNDVDNINPEIISKYNGEDYDYGKASDYKNAMVQWGVDNLDSKIVKKKIAVIRENGDLEIVMSVYDIDLKSGNGDDFYLVISESPENLKFNSDESFKRIDDFTVFDVDGEMKTSFYYEGDEDLAFFVSPDLNELPVVLEIEACNFNRICEEDQGENAKNCFSDCKSIANFAKLMFFPLLVLLFGIFVYTVLQEWYKFKYETHLFKDRKYLFNLLMFIDNARIRGIGDGDIRRELRKAKWTNEQITYSLKKASGKRTGMYELVPIEKFYSLMRVRKAKQKFNKQKSQRIDRW